MALQAVQKKPECDAIACQDCGLYQLCLPMGLNSADTMLLDRYVKRKRVVKRGQILYRLGE